MFPTRGRRSRTPLSNGRFRVSANPRRTTRIGAQSRHCRSLQVPLDLLVSHWPVFDDIAPLLTVEALKRSEAGQPRPEAMQAAMREIRMNPELDAAHPVVWAPFTLVGEGR